MEAVFPGLKEADRAAATARRKIEDGPTAGFYVRGVRLTPGVSLRFDRCCMPVPGDRIVGIAERQGAGGARHRLRPNWPNSRIRKTSGATCSGPPEAERDTVSIARLQATIRDAPGVLGQACTIIGEAGGNIVGLNMHHRTRPSSTRISTSR